MNKTCYTLISVSILTALYHSPARANLTQQCLLGVPQFQGEIIQGDINNLPVYIESDFAQVNTPSLAKYTGNVQVQQGNRSLLTQSLEIKQTGENQDTSRFAYINDGLDYKDNLINLTGTEASVNLANRDADIRQAGYQLVGRQGRGEAQDVQLRERYRTLKNASFTSCLPNDNAWVIYANEMRQDLKEEVAEMWHARFHILGVPVFYLPYFQLPVGDKRRSGLLLPDFGSSSRDGYFYAQPLYWNIAPNYDATITPKYMSHRGWQLNSEFRYLTALGEGSLAGEYLNDDRYSDYTGENRSRHLFHWTHQATLQQNWRLNIDYTRVSDKRYFNDFSSDYGSSTDGYATQTAKIAYYQPHYNIALSVKQFQIFDDVDIGPYRALPQLDFNYYRNNIADSRFDFKLFSQAVRFDNDSQLMPKAWRFHLEPSLNLPLANNYGSLNIETKVYATHYQQQKGKAANAEEVERRVNRFIPQIKVDLQTILASNQTFIPDYTQTLEPHIQYLYRPYRDQSNIGSSLNSSYLGYGYDSTLLQQDYFSLFRDRRYSGLDRIASANQVTVGGTTRLFDQQGDERFNVSLGQIYYITPSRIDNNQNNNTSSSSSSWALETNWKINDQWSWRGSYQYDTSLDETSLANSTLQYNPDGNNIIQLSYRYASEAYIDQNLTESANRYNQDIKQLGMTIGWELNDNWAVIGRYYHDIALNKPIEQYAGIQYNTCCWSASVGYRRYATSKDNQQYQYDNEVFYDNSLTFMVELRGLGGSHNSGISRMLGKGLIPYADPFDL